MIIAVSKLAPNYGKWLKRLNGEIEVMDLYGLSPAEAEEKASAASGILLTGGSDIHPRHYGRNEDLAYCRDIDEKRDEMELAVIDLAFRYKIPLLGICRGHQILNVAAKGTLYADIPAFFSSSIPHSGKEDVYHRVNIKENSVLYQVTGVNTEIVNSAHHQAVNHLAKGFVSVAHGPDFIVEAIEAGPAMDHPFCVAVQWHPERMEFDHPLSGRLGNGFMEAAGGRNR